MPDIVALDRLKSQLLTSGLSEKNNALFQVINQLIDFLRQTINSTNTRITNITPVSPPSGSTVITSGMPIPDFFGDAGEMGPIGPPGQVGPRGFNGPMGPPGMDGYCDCEGGLHYIGNVIIP